MAVTIAAIQGPPKWCSIVTVPAIANLFELPERLTVEEVFEILARGRDLTIERIVSAGHSTPEGQWYDQMTDEWVGLLQGEAQLRYGDGSIQQLQAGDWILIPAHLKHRVDRTSQSPPCVWLAIHGELSAAPLSSMGTQS